MLKRTKLTRLQQLPPIHYDKCKEQANIKAAGISAQLFTRLGEHGELTAKSICKRKGFRTSVTYSTRYRSRARLERTNTHDDCPLRFSWW
jgi:hypothetical protein